MEMLVAIDAGNYEVKVVGPRGVDRFPSVIGEWRERGVVQAHGDSDMEWTFDGHPLGRGFAGTLALHESDFGSAAKGTTKLHPDALLRVLLALHRYMETGVVRIVTGQPLKTHQRDKAGIKAMLEGRHTLTVNGRAKTFLIERAEVAPEGGAVFLTGSKAGVIRIMDPGSGTVNLATVRDMKYNDRESLTLPFGSETRGRDMAAMGRAVCNEALGRWEREDEVWVVGGYAHSILPHIKPYFPNATAYAPALNGQRLDPVFANAAAFYELGRRAMQ